MLAGVVQGGRREGEAVWGATKGYIGERRQEDKTHIGLSSLAPRDSLSVANITRDLQIFT